MNIQDVIIVEVGSSEIFLNPSNNTITAANSISVNPQSLNHCFKCYKQTSCLFMECPCLKHAWCSIECMFNDQHIKTCNLAYKIGNDPRMIQISPPDQNALQGFTGLKNLGNTCYMNSAI